MFGLFKSKPPKKQIDYLVYRTEVAKYKMMVDDIKQKFTSAGVVVVVCFFKDTYDELERLFEASGVNKGDHDTTFSLFMFDQTEWKRLGDDYDLVLAEIHPLSSSMQVVLDSYTGNTSLSCYVSLDNAFFNLFGGDRLITLLDSLGIEEYEMISHTMVNKSIDNAQKKIEAKVEFPKTTNSLDEWMKVNVKD